MQLHLKKGLTELVKPFLVQLKAEPPAGGDKGILPFPVDGSLGKFLRYAQAPNP